MKRKAIKGFEGKYEVWSDGTIFSLIRKRPLIHKITKTGYHFVHLGQDGGYWYVHRLVAEAFIENPNKLNTVNHKDENKDNNNASNLEWCATDYNNKYGSRLQNVKINQPNRKPVGMFDKNTGELIKTFISIGEAAKYINGYTWNIGNCCNNRVKTSYGYKWKFIEGGE